MRECTKCGKEAPILYEVQAEYERVSFMPKSLVIGGEPRQAREVTHTNHQMANVCKECALKTLGALKVQQDQFAMRVTWPLREMDGD